MNYETGNPQDPQSPQNEGIESPLNQRPATWHAWCPGVVSRLATCPIIWIGGLTVALRLLTLGKPLTGYFSLRNCVCAMAARNWALGRSSFWNPMFDCIRGGERSLHMVEVPCSAYLAGLAWRIFGGSLDVWGRLLSVGWMLAAVLALYYYVRRHHGPTAAAGAAFALAVSPVSILFGQHFMLEPSMVFLTIGTISALDLGLSSGRGRWLVFAAIAWSLLLLTKIYMVVLLLPIGWMFLLAAGPSRIGRLVPARSDKTGKNARGQARQSGSDPPLTFMIVALSLLFLASLPALVWYFHAYSVGSPGHPLADRVYYSVAHSAESHRLPHPLWVSPPFYSHVLNDFATLVVTPVGFLLFWLGLLDRGARRHLVWLAASLLLIGLLPRKFYEMSYYYMVILPPVCVMVGLGWSRLARGVSLSRGAIFLTVLLAVAVSMRYALGPLWVTVEEDQPVVAAADAVKRQSGPEDRVIAIHATGVDLLYYCDRAGWTGQMRPDDWETWVESCIAQGAKYLVVVETTSRPTPPVANFRSVHTPPIEKGPGWQVFRLKVGQGLP